MQAVTQEFKNSWEAMPRRVAVFRVEMKRRFFNGSIFTLEASPVVFEADEIVKISAINWKLDSVKQNRILASNVTIRMKNERWKWVETNVTDGLFKPTAVATLGFDPYKTEFKVFYGYELQDGTVESIALFTGEAISYLFDTGNKEVEIQVTGGELKLQTADAQNVVNTFTNEPTDPAQGDNVNKEFLTVFSNWLVDIVREDTSPADQGDLGYKLEDVNEAEKKAKIVFGTAPGSGVDIDWSGRQWKRDEKVSTLVGFLCDEAGIIPANRDIAEPVFPSVASFKDIDIQSDWESGTLLQNITTRAPIGSIGRKWFKLDDFADGDFTNNPAWAITIIGSSTVSVVSNKLLLVSGVSGVIDRALATTPQTQAFGTWEFNSEVRAAGPGVNTEQNDIRFISTNAFRNGNGYGFRFDPGGQFAFGRFDGLLFVTLGGLSFGAIDSVPTTWRVTRELDGTFEVFRDGVSQGTAVDTTYQTSTHFLALTGAAANTSDTSLRLDFIRWSEEVNPSEDFTDADAIFESEVFDLLSPATDWGILEFIQSLNGGTIVYETAVADFEVGPFDAFVPLGTGNLIESALKQFVKVRAKITPLTTLPSIGPKIAKIVINFSATSLFIAHADFKGKNCFEAIQRLAEISNGEFGFTGAGRFFFRQKDVSPSSVLTLDQSNAIEKISTFNAGYDRVINVAQVDYDPYYKEVDSVTELEPSPTSIERFGKKISQITVTDFLFSNNADFSESIAKLIFESGFKPRRRGRLICRIIPHLELSDVITVSFHDSPLIAQNVFGDEAQVGFPAFGDDTNTIARDILFKVVGITFDFFKAKSILEVEEVLI